MNPITFGQIVNLVSSCIGLVLAGVFIAVVDKNFWKHWVTKTGFIVWCFRWISYLVAYLWMLKKLPLAPMLPILDVGSIATLSFALILVSSDHNNTKAFFKTSLPWLIGAAIVLLTGMIAYLFSDTVPVSYRLFYLMTSIGPSELMANVGTIAMGWAFAVRYRSLTAYLLLCLCLLYAFGQMPAYSDVFVFRVLATTVSNDLFQSPSWIFAVLALLKIMIAVMSLCLFYTPFIKSAVLSPDDEAARPKWPIDIIEAAPHRPTGEMVPLARNVRRLLHGSVVAIWTVAAFLVGVYLHFR